MTESYDKNSSVVVLPAAGHGRLRDRALASWLAQSDLVRTATPVDALASVLAEIGRPAPTSGQAALRMWGQTGDRPATWIAAADPVYLEPQLDRLCLHALDGGQVPVAELGPLIDHLQRTLGSRSGYGFACIGTAAYLTCQHGIATAGVPAGVVDQRAPDEFLPRGDNVASHRRLLSEIEMALHEHEVNLARIAAGRQPVNSLWIWGGGVAPEQQTEPQPPLFSDDPLLAGYWRSRTGLVEPWPGSIAGCLDVAVAGFVATLPDSAGVDELEACLHELRIALRSHRLSKLVLLFRDGLRAEVHRAHALRVWRRNSDLLAPQDKA